VFGGGDGEALGDGTPRIPEPAPSAPSEDTTETEAA
jgi:hypothetical protein